MLSCNVFMATGDRCVRSAGRHGQVLTAYERETHPLSWSADRTSGFPPATHTPPQPHHWPAHQGCYVCVLDVYPSGSQQGRTCLTL
ncbi:unnamed protein product [Merluccius merluccius]